MSYQLGITLARSARKNTLTSEQAKYICGWLLSLSNGKDCPVFKLANSLIANQPLNATMTLAAIHALECQHVGAWRGARQLVIANCLAGLMLGNDPASVIARTCEFIMAHENKMVQ